MNRKKKRCQQTIGWKESRKKEGATTVKPAVTDAHAHDFTWIKTSQFQAEIRTNRLQLWEEGSFGCWETTTLEQSNKKLYSKILKM